VEENLLILANGLVLTCDPDNRAGRLSLLLDGGRIAALAESPEPLMASHPGAPVEDVSDSLITPGFVNAHFHGESVFLRSATDGKRMREWSTDPHVQQRIKELSGSSKQQLLAATYRAASAAHLKNGTTTVGEYLPAVDSDGLQSVLDALATTGLRSVLALQHWEQVEYVKGLADTGLRTLVSLGNAEDFTVYGFESSVLAAAELQCPIVAHVGEIPDDGEYVRRKFSRSLLELLREYGILHRETVLVHLNHLHSSDLRIVRMEGATVTLCPGSAVAKRTGCPVLRQLRSTPVPVCLGTDWGTTDMMKEMQFVLRLPFLFPDVAEFSPMQILRMATIQSAAALGLGAEVGSIEAGKSADLLRFSLRDVRTVPLPQTMTADALASFLIDRLSTEQVTHVMVRGEYLVRAGVLTRLDEQDAVGAFHNFTALPPPEASPAGQRTGGARTAVRREKKVPPAMFSGGVREHLSGVEHVEPPQSAIDSPAAPDPPREPGSSPSDSDESQDQRPGLTPALPKNVRRVFGEDDET
jgi:5-methylthioadenosine/S-adenosylhomocysteine deaminase